MKNNIKNAIQNGLREGLEFNDVDDIGKIKKKSADSKTSYYKELQLQMYEMASDSDVVGIYQLCCENNIKYKFSNDHKDIFHHFMIEWNRNFSLTDPTDIIDFNECDDFGVKDGYGWVDLGTGIKWCISNVGTKHPFKVGKFFQWGSTHGENWFNKYQLPEKFATIHTAPFIQQRTRLGNTYFNYIKYTRSGSSLLPNDDAATQIMGRNWRMPTPEELSTITTGTTAGNKCEFKLMRKGDMIKITSKINGMYIYIV